MAELSLKDLDWGYIPGSRGDQPSLSDLLALRQQLIAGQNNSVINTINPGVTWGGKDPLAVQPNDVMGDYFYPQRRREDI